jgi:hypothetical protein
MRHFLASALVALLCATSLPAFGQSSPRIRSIGDDIRFALERSASESKQPVSNWLRGRGRAVGNSPSILPSISIPCDISSAIYWDAAGRWIAENTLRPAPQTGEDALDLMTHRNHLRALARRSEHAINTAPERFYLAQGEDIAMSPKDRASDLRQRAEWTAFMAALLTQMRAEHQAAPQDFGRAFGLSLWTRTACKLVEGNRAAATNALAAIGYPNAGQYGEKTEEAFTLLVRASGDALLAKNALTAAGERASPAAQRLLGAMSSSPTQ